MIAVRPAQHYTMGGVRTDHSGQSATLRGLFAAGEAACWDLHGFNRLGGNSVAESVVAGMIVGDFVADCCDASANDAHIPAGLVRDFIAAEQAKLDALVAGSGSEDASALRVAMQEIMTAKVGIFRAGADLAAAVTGLQSLLKRSCHIGFRHKVAGGNTELATAYQWPHVDGRDHRQAHQHRARRAGAGRDTGRGGHRLPLLRGDAGRRPGRAAAGRGSGHARPCRTGGGGTAVAAPSAPRC